MLLQTQSSSDELRKQCTANNQRKFIERESALPCISSPVLVFDDYADGGFGVHQMMEMQNADAMSLHFSANIHLL